MLPILIVCYLRPKKLELLLNSFNESKRKFFIFIDRADEPYLKLNREVFNIAVKFQASLDIEIQWSNVHKGVAHGVPTGLDWAFSKVDSLIILEDDCLPNSFSLDYFDKQIINIGVGSIVMACASSPWSEFTDSKHKIPLTLSKYPLIWGWSTNKSSWARIKTLINSEPPHMQVLKKIFSKPKDAKAICFFYAAVIRVHRNKLNAWDSPVALNMLLCNFKAIISNVNLIQNSGQDDIASHYSNPNMLLNQIVSASEDKQANKYLNNSKSWSAKVDSEIEKRVYSLRVRHLLSPIKALIGI